MIEAYSKVPQPHGTVVAADIFSSGIIMSEYVLSLIVIVDGTDPLSPCQHGLCSVRKVFGNLGIGCGSG